jgi:hypothetical protein
MLLEIVGETAMCQGPVLELMLCRANDEPALGMSA